MAETNKKRRAADEALPETWEEGEALPAFSYDLDGDALYRLYRDRYTRSARLAMEDTMGRAAALTGGYGSSYAQSLGQQRYDETMQGLSELIPDLEERAYKRWKDQGDALREGYERQSKQAAAEQARADEAYSRLYALIVAAGYEPDEEELAAAGMSRRAAEALLREYLRKTGQG